MLVYSTEITPRLKYIFNYLLIDLIGIHEVTFTSDLNNYLSYTHPKIAYCRDYIENGIYFESTNLLFEKEIIPLSPKCFVYKNLPAFFKTTNPKSTLPFDLFAASFYLISRYEEYLPFKKDDFGRFSAKESLAYKNGFLNRPVVNEYAVLLKNSILEKYPTLKTNQPKFEYINTFDIDSIYAFKGKGFLRTFGGFIKDIASLNTKQLVKRYQVVFKNQKDPLDVFNELFNVLEKYPFKTIFFILSGKYGKYDKNIPLTNQYFKKLIHTFSNNYLLGIHPSYASNLNKKLLQNELSNLQSIANCSVNLSRQHYLKLQFPETYETLLSLNIHNDYTMGFHDANGFRASCCRPFKFFNLKTNEETSLTIHPFCFMDATFRYYKNSSIASAFEEIKQLIDINHKYNGLCYALWHNDILSDYFPWENWHKLFEMTNEYVFKKYKS
jgi:hypothetical protein